MSGRSLQFRQRMRGNAFAVTHGHSPREGETVEYKAWIRMKSKVHNPNHHSYYLFGGRGIGIHPSWDESFLAFYASVGPKPADHLCLKLLDETRDFEPGNVGWRPRGWRPPPAESPS